MGGRCMVIQGLLFRRSAASGFCGLGKVRLCEQRELCMGNIRRSEQEARAQETRQGNFAVPAWETAMPDL